MENSPVELLIHFDEKPRKEAFLRRRRYMYITAWAYLVFLLLIQVPLLLQGGSDWQDHVGLLSGEVIALALCFSAPRLSYWLYMRRFRKLYPNEVPDVQVQFGESIVYTTGNSRVEYKYEWIANTKKYRYSYALVSKGNEHLLLPYDSFVKGDMDALRTLLRERCPNLKKVK